MIETNRQGERGGEREGESHKHGIILPLINMRQELNKRRSEVKNVLSLVIALELTLNNSRSVIL